MLDCIDARATRGSNVSIARIGTSGDTQIPLATDMENASNWVHFQAAEVSVAIQNIVSSRSQTAGFVPTSAPSPASPTPSPAQANLPPEVSNRVANDARRLFRDAPGAMLIAQNVPVAASPASSAPVDFRNVANSEQQRTLAVTNIRAILNMAGMDPARPVRIQIRGEPIAMRTRGSAPEVEAPPTASMATTLPARSLAELAALPKPGLTCTPTTFELLLSQESNVPGQPPRAALVHVSFNEINHGGLQYGVAFAKPWDPAQNDYVAPKGKPIDAWAVGATVSDTGGNPALVPEEANAVSTLLSLAIADPAALNIDTLQDGRQFIRPGGSFMLNP